jgi:hypothetical protein
LCWLWLLPCVRSEGPTFNFDNGQLPAGTIFTGNQSGTGVTNTGGFTNSGCMVLTRPGTGAQNYGQWVITNDLANGLPVTAFNVSFKLYLLLPA